MPLSHEIVKALTIFVLYSMLGSFAGFCFCAFVAFAVWLNRPAEIIQLYSIAFFLFNLTYLLRANNEKPLILIARITSFCYGYYMVVLIT